ncbi:MAG: efflux RND transporter periplasmic adaptor subunit [Gemmataceae bacterium]
MLAAGCYPAAPTAATTAPKELPTATVTVAPVTARSVQRTVAAVGTLNGYEEVTVAPKVDGRVVSLHADVGDFVIPGQVLLDLDPTDYKHEVARARRGLELELAKAALTRMPADGQFDIEAVPMVRRAALSLDQAKREWDRVEKLPGLSDKERTTALTEFQVADATKKHTLSEVRTVMATARLRQAELDTAEQKLADTKLTCPEPAGWAAWAAAVGPGFAPLRYAVAQRLVSEGEMVRSQPVTNAYKLVIAHALKLRAAVPERFAGEVKVGQTVEVRVDAYPGAVFAGRVARVNPTVDPVNRTFQVEVAVPNLDGKLKAGGFARAAVRTHAETIKTVPPDALVTFAGVTKVFVVADGHAKAVEVRTGGREKDYVEVLGDLPAGASVATSGFSLLVDGSPVKLRD